MYSTKMQATTMNLINVVEKERQKRRMSDRKFSMEVLDISPSYYCLLKQGNRPITWNLLNLFKEKLPEITNEITIFFLSQGNDGPNKKGVAKNMGRNQVGIEECMPTPSEGRKT